MGKLKIVADCILVQNDPHIQKPVLRKRVVFWTGVGAAVVIIIAACLTVPTSKVPHRSHPPTNTTILSGNQSVVTAHRENIQNVATAKPPKSTSHLRALPHRQQVLARAGVDALPMGTTIAVVLENKVVSLDADTPVVALVGEDVSFEGVVSIPSESKVYGKARLNTETERLEVVFSTVVFPDGRERSLSAFAFDKDMAYGLLGRYDSKEAQKTLASTAGQFVSGLASGLKEKSATPGGPPMEQGTLRNGILNAITASAMGYATKRAQDMSSMQPVLILPAGKQFFIFLNRKFE